jgi:hypothetical protein
MPDSLLPRRMAPSGEFFHRAARPIQNRQIGAGVTALSLIDLCCSQMQQR